MRYKFGSSEVILGVGGDKFDLFCGFVDGHNNAELAVVFDCVGEGECVLFGVLYDFDEWGCVGVGDWILAPDVVDAGLYFRYSIGDFSDFIGDGGSLSKLIGLLFEY